MSGEDAFPPDAGGCCDAVGLVVALPASTVGALLATLCEPSEHGPLLLFPDQLLASLFAAQFARHGVSGRFVTVSADDPLFPLGEMAAAVGVRVPSRRLRDVLDPVVPPGPAELANVAVSVRSAGFDRAALSAVLPARWAVSDASCDAAWRHAGACLRRRPTRPQHVIARSRHDCWSRSGLSALATLETLCRLASSDGTACFALELLASYAALSPSTCRRALGQLTRRGYLRRLPPGPAGVWHVELLVPPGPVAPDATSAGLPGVLPEVHSPGDLGAVTAGGVTRAAVRVWRELGCRPSRPLDVARALGLSPQTVARHLRRLAEQGWASSDGTGGWVALEPVLAGPSRRERAFQVRAAGRRRTREARRSWLRLRREMERDRAAAAGSSR